MDYVKLRNIKKILKEIDKVKEQLKDAEENGAEPYYIEGLNNHLNDLLEALDILSKNLAAVNEVPEFDLSTLNTPAGDGNNFGTKTPKAKPEAKEGRVLPNTGMNPSNTAVLGLSLIALAGIVVRRKLSK